MEQRRFQTYSYQAHTWRLSDCWMNTFACDIEVQKAINFIHLFCSLLFLLLFYISIAPVAIRSWLLRSTQYKWIVIWHEYRWCKNHKCSIIIRQLTAENHPMFCLFHKKCPEWYPTFSPENQNVTILNTSDIQWYTYIINS